VTCQSVDGIIVRISEYTWYTKSWEGSNSDRELIGFEVFFGHRASAMVDRKRAMLDAFPGAIIQRQT